MIRLWPGSMFGRLVIILIIGLLLAQIASVVIHWRDRGHALHRASVRGLADRVAEIVHSLDELPAQEQEAAARHLSNRRLRVKITDKDTVAPDYTQPPPVASAMAGMLKRALGETRSITVRAWHRRSPHAGRAGPPGERRPWRGPRDWFFSVHTPLESGNVAEFRFRVAEESIAAPTRLLLSIGVLIVSVIALALVAVRQATRPLSMLARAASELGHDINRPPLAEDRGPLEVRQAAAAFNRMQERIKTFMAERSRMLAAVSHDLKTPITRLRIRAEMLDDESLREKFNSDLDEMETMVGETLEFMRDIEAAEPLQAVDLKALLESIQDDANRQDQSVLLDAQQIEPYRGRPVALKRALANLIGNAVKYGSRAEVYLRETANGVEIEVCDVGPGIQAEHMGRVFEPFYRVEGSRSRHTGGSGMGLAVARNVARAHGGDIQLSNRSEGGLRARLTLPRSATE